MYLNDIINGNDLDDILTVLAMICPFWLVRFNDISPMTVDDK